MAQVSTSPQQTKPLKNSKNGIQKPSSGYALKTLLGSKGALTDPGRAYNGTFRTERATDFGPTIQRTVLKVGDPVMVKFYKDRVFPGKSKRRAQKGRKVNRKRSVIEVPRYLIEARSPGCRLRVMLAQLEAAQVAKKKRKRVRSPGAAPYGFFIKKKSSKKNCPRNLHVPVKTQAIATTPKDVKTKSVTVASQTASPKLAVWTGSGSAKAKGASKSPASRKVTRAFSVDPMKAEFTTKGGHTRHLMVNDSNVRYAVKVKSSNNDYFRVNPVYSFLDPGTMNELEVMRLPGGMPKVDKLLICYAEAREDEINPKKYFTLKSTFQSIFINIVTKN